VQNIADKRYVSTCLPRGDCFFGARRTANVTATYRF
jgi:iron complex outermembrane receptor protein